jgi:uncharacterized damage-inducible protein DinB
MLIFLTSVERDAKASTILWNVAGHPGTCQPATGREITPNYINRPSRDMRNIIDSIRGEYLRYKSLAEAAIDQLDDAQLSTDGPNGGNSIAVICWHVAGNLQSRFTDFLTTDGEKPWRQREEEFRHRTVSGAEVRDKWQQGWAPLLATLDALSDADLPRTITIRQQPLRVDEALHRSLAHTSYHVGQIVYLAKSFRGKDWKYLSIPPGQSDTYAKSPTRDAASAHHAALGQQSKRK